METQIHQLEQEAYSSILRAFKAQSDTLTWVFIHTHAIRLVSESYFFFIFSVYYSKITPEINSSGEGGADNRTKKRVKSI